MIRLTIAAGALIALSLPALAQNAGGPGRVGYPGQIGAGVPGSRPNVVEQRMMERKAAVPAPKPARTARKARKKKAM